MKTAPPPIFFKVPVLPNPYACICAFMTGAVVISAGIAGAYYLGTLFVGA